jgi:hypothetical protein
MTKPKPHPFYCWMKVIERPTGSRPDPVRIMIPGRPPGKKAAKNSSDYDELWIAIEPYYNEPTTSTHVLDYWSGEAFADEKDATDWLNTTQAGKDWLHKPMAVYYTLIAFHVSVK